MKAVTLECVVLHNISIEICDVTIRNWDLQFDARTNERRPSNVIRDLLNASQSTNSRQNKEAEEIRNSLKEKIARDKILLMTVLCI